MHLSNAWLGEARPAGRGGSGRRGAGTRSCRGSRSRSEADHADADEELAGDLIVGAALGDHGQFTDSFDAVFQADGVRILASPPQAPGANATCERIIGTLRREVLDQPLIVSEHHLRQALTEYLVHYNTARLHCALGQLAPDQAHTWPRQINLAEHRIRRKQVLSGLTSEYQIAA